MSEVKGKISVSDFVKGYNQLANQTLKDNYIKKHIKTTYAPLLNKKLILEAMHEKSVVDGDIKYVDLIVSKLNLVMAVLVLYTDIEPDKNEEGKPLTWESYDKLKSTGLLESVSMVIGEDINELMSVQKSVMDSWTIKNTSTEAFVTNLVDVASRKLGVVAGASMDKLTEVLNDESKMKKVAGALDKVLKKIK